MSKAATLSQANSNKKLISLLQAKPNDNSSAAIENCLKEGADANARDWYNSSALVIAIHNKHDYLAISHLLNYGANPNDLDAHHTVLWHAIYNNHSLPTIKLLIDKGADPNLGGTKYIAESPLSLALAQKKKS
jgi:ankyrin repeat protein